MIKDQGTRNKEKGTRKRNEDKFIIIYKNILIYDE